MSKTIDMVGIERFIIVSAKRFFSGENKNKMKRRRLNYIISLRRNSSLIPEPDHFTNVFLYDGKPVN